MICILRLVVGFLVFGSTVVVVGLCYGTIFLLVYHLLLVWSLWYVTFCAWCILACDWLLVVLELERLSQQVLPEVTTGFVNTSSSYQPVVTVFIISG